MIGQGGIHLKALRVEEFEFTPILRGVLPHTGLLDGDDYGYRGTREVQGKIVPCIEICKQDFDQPDMLVSLADLGIATHHLDAVGRLPGLTPHKFALGEIAPVLNRLPVALGLVEANRYLAHYDREVLVVSGLRTALMQAREWRQSWCHLNPTKNVEDDLPIEEEIVLGNKCDNLTAFCAIKVDLLYQDVCADFARKRSTEISAAARKLGMTEDQVINKALTYQTNRGFLSLNLDADALTAHGNGGATDCWTKKRGDIANKPIFLGVEYEHLGPAGVMNYFEWANLADYQHQVATHPALKQTMVELGIDEVTQALFNNCRRERRILYHSMMAIGCTYFSLGHDEGEPWHFNHGNSRYGRQVAVLPGAGSSCHGILKDIRGPKGLWAAVWTNTVAQRDLYPPIRDAWLAKQAALAQAA